MSNLARSTCVALCDRSTASRVVQGRCQVGSRGPQSPVPGPLENIAGSHMVFAHKTQIPCSMKSGLSRVGSHLSNPGSALVHVTHTDHCASFQRSSQVHKGQEYPQGEVRCVTGLRGGVTRMRRALRRCAKRRRRVVMTSLAAQQRTTRLSDESLWFISPKLSKY